MGGPFSYNDKNFTVIGNICFAHIYSKPVKVNEKICEVPPEIASRLIQKSAHGTLQTSYFGGGGATFYGKIIKENNKYYVSTNSETKYEYYIMFYLFLKDI